MDMLMELSTINNSGDGSGTACGEDFDWRYLPSKASGYGVGYASGYGWERAYGKGAACGAEWYFKNLYFYTIPYGWGHSNITVETFSTRYCDMRLCKMPLGITKEIFYQLLLSR